MTNIVDVATVNIWCRSTVSEPVEDAVLFMVHYLQEVQGPKYVVGRDVAFIAATPEARRLFLSTVKHVLLQVLRSNIPYMGIHMNLVFRLSSGTEVT